VGGGALAVFDYKLYPKFVSLVKVVDKIEPKVEPVLWLMRIIEDLYDARYAKDIEALRRSKDEEGEGEDELSTPFPDFVYAFFEKKFGLSNIVQGRCWNLLRTLHELRKENTAVETFARFMEEYYDADDLLFFLYSRSTLQKELAKEKMAEHPMHNHWTFRTHWGELSATSSTLYVNERQCSNVSRIIFGSEADVNYRAFMLLLDQGHLRYPGGVPTGGASKALRRTEVSTFLHLSLSRYHETRGRAGDAGPIASSGGGSDADKLFREAVNAYEDRRRGLGLGSPTPSSSTATATAAAPGASTQPLAPSKALLASIGERMNEAMEGSLERLLVNHSELSEVMRDMVRSELLEALERQVDSLLGEVIAAASPGAPLSGNPETDALARRFVSLVADDNAGRGSEAASETFCQEIVGSGAVREPMVKLTEMLVQYAKEQTVSSE